jgi:hypothetical protein
MDWHMGRFRKNTAAAGDTVARAPAGDQTIHIGDLVTAASDRAVLEGAARALSEAQMPAVLLVNFDIGRQIDLVIATEQGVLVVEAKGNRTPVRGQANSAADWAARTGTGRWVPFRSPVRQADEARLALRDRLAMFLGSPPPYFPGAVIFAPQVPRGSEIPSGDFKVRIGDLSDLRTWVIQQNGSSEVSLAQWRAFAAHLGLRGVSGVAAACDGNIDAADTLVDTYLNTFRATYRSKADDLISIPCEGAVGIETSLAFAEAVAAGESIALIGRSGCGKTLAACRSGILAAECGRVPIFIGAKDFEGEFGRLLNREATLLGALSSAALLAACQRLDRAILLIIDGYNECAEQNRGALVRAIAAMAERYGANVAITSQIGLPLPELFSIPEVRLNPISEETKLAIAGKAARSPIHSSVRGWIAAVRTGLEARMIGELQDSIAEPGNRSSLFAAFVRHRLSSHGTQAIRLLTLLAKTLSDRLSFSLAVREIDRVAEALGFDPALLDALERAGLIVRRGARVSFDHEMYLDVFAAEAIVRDAEGNPDKILDALKQPLHRGRGAVIVGALDDDRLQLAVLADISIPQVFADCLEGACGSFAQQWARQRANVVIARMAEEAEALSFEYDETEYPPFRRTDAFAGSWSAADIGFVDALPMALVSGSFVEPVFEIIATADTRLRSEFDRLRPTLAGKKIGIRSGLFQLSYVHGSHGPIIGRVVKAVHTGSLRREPNAAADIVRAWAGKRGLTHGQIYLLLMLDRIAWDDGPLVASLVPAWLRETYRFAPYHLQLDLIQAAHFAHRAPVSVRQEIIDALHDLPSDQHIFLSSSIIEALASLGAFGDDEAEEAARLREQIRGLLERGDAEAGQLALTIWMCQFDHPFASAYCGAVSELDPERRKTFLSLACSAAESGTTTFAYPLMVELAACGDSSSGKLLERWLNLPQGNCPFPQDAVREFVGAHLCLARLVCPLPSNRPAPARPAESALSAWAELLYWINRIDLPVEARRLACRTALSVLLRHDDGVAVATLHELDRCFLGEGLDRLPGNEPVHTQIEGFFSAEAAEICRRCLDRPELQSGYFAYRDLSEILRFAVTGLGRFGDLTDIPTLRSIASMDALGSNAIRAIALLEQRHLSAS